MSTNTDSSGKSDGSTKTTRMLRGDVGGGPVKQAPTPLGIPELISPVNGQHFPPYPRTLTLAWKVVSGATGYVVTVQFYSNTPQGKTWLTKPPVNVASTSLTVDFPSNVPGRWCVRTVDNTGAHTPSPDSAWSNFDLNMLLRWMGKNCLGSANNNGTFAFY